MAKWIKLGEPENNGERAAQQLLEKELPDKYLLVTNFSILGANHSPDVDALVLGTAGLFVIEIKDWGGTLRGRNYQKWEQNGRPMRNPVEQIVRVRRILVSFIRANAERAYADARFFLGTNFYGVLALVNPHADTSQIQLQPDRWLRIALCLDDLPKVIQEDQAQSKYFLTHADICGIASLLGAPPEELDTWCSHCHNPRNRAGGKFCNRCGKALNPTSGG